MNTPKPFNDENFLLQSPTAERLYHDYAKGLPIIDYHCHLSPEQIARDRRFADMTELWLEGDHYKWRAMRSNGVEERFITGDSSSWEKFEKWAETVPYVMRNPLYHWSHLELKTGFGIEKLLNPASAREIFEECNSQLSTPDFSARGLMRKYNVELVCTTDDPIDSLEHHQKCKADGFEVKVLPTWRPDKAMALEGGEIYLQYVERLSTASAINIDSFESLIEALKVRHDFFHSVGCRLSDHGLESFYAEEYTLDQVDATLKKVLKGETPSATEISKFKSAMMVEFARMDHAKGWTQQFHYGTIRNNNSRMFKQLGPDTGFDSIGDFSAASSMAKFFDRLDCEDKLAKSIIYNLNPKDNEVVATMLGNFQDGRYGAGKIQFGSGWWFLDQKDGIEKQINSLSVLGLLSRFVGMLTDSRSFISYPRHEYFRRILCDIVARDIDQGLLPSSEMEFIGREIIQAVSYTNARNYFGF